MAKKLNDLQLQKYNTDGYCHPFDVLTPKESVYCLNKLETYERVSGGAIGGIY